MSATVVRIDRVGRLSVPAPHRRALGLEGGGPVVLSLVGNELRVRPVGVAMAELQAEAAALLGGDGASVTAFLDAGRRAPPENREAAEALSSGLERDASGER